MLICGSCFAQKLGSSYDKLCHWYPRGAKNAIYSSASPTTDAGPRNGPAQKNGPALAGHGAEAVRDAIAKSIQDLPEHLRRSLTCDQGAEMAQHEKLKSETGIDVYFCDPQSLLSADCFAIACRAVRGKGGIAPAIRRRRPESLMQSELEEISRALSAPLCQGSCPLLYFSLIFRWAD
jgi:hypothetical protein